MEIFQFDRGEKSVGRFGSRGFLATRIAAGEGKIHLTCLTSSRMVLSARIRRPIHSSS